MSSESDRGCPTVVNLNIISMEKNFVHSFYIYLILSDPPDCSYDLLHINVLYMYIYVFSFKSFFSCLYRVCSFVMILYHTFLYVLLTICFYVKSLYLFLFYALCLDAVKLNKPLNMNFVLWISDMYAPKERGGIQSLAPPPTPRPF